jgi:hypothetical protein
MWKSRFGLYSNKPNNTQPGRTVFSKFINSGMKIFRFLPGMKIFRFLPENKKIYGKKKCSPQKICFWVFGEMFFFLVKITPSLALICWSAQQIASRHIFTSVASFYALTKSGTIPQVSRTMTGFPSNEPLPVYSRAHHCHRAVMLSVWT